MHRRWPRNGHDRGANLLSTARPTTVVLLRHGRTPSTGTVLPGRATGLHLSSEGLAQAERMAVFLPALIGPITAIYASPLERAAETAAPLARQTGLTVTTSADLIESDYGTWTGEKLSSLRRKREWRELMDRASSFVFPEGESLNDTLGRIRSFVVGCASTHLGQSVVGVSHADPIRALITDALGLHLDAIHRIHVDTASATILSVTNNTVTLRSYNIQSPNGAARVPLN
ncbi:MAG: histidine phosphatase family protein [Ferrimicrobium sp.]